MANELDELDKLDELDELDELDKLEAGLLFSSNETREGGGRTGEPTTGATACLQALWKLWSHLKEPYVRC